MASFTCLVVGGTKRVRVERSVRPPADEPNVPPWRTLRQNSPKGALLPRTIWGEQRQPYPLASGLAVYDRGELTALAAGATGLPWQISAARANTKIDLTRAA